MTIEDAHRRRPRVAYFVSHPIQYQAPLLAQISSEAAFDLHVVFTESSDTSRFDAGFGQDIAYDVPLLHGYSSECLRLRSLPRLLRKSDLVWLHGWAPPVHLVILALCRLVRKPVVVRSETWDLAHQSDGWRSQYREAFHRTIYRSSSAVLCIGSRNRAYAERLAPRTPKFMVPYAVDNARFERVSRSMQRDDIRAMLDLPLGRKIVLFAGKLSARKRPDLLLRAWQSAEWGTQERPILLFVGDGDLRATLETAASGDRDVVFHGFVNQSELPFYYASADIFVLVSEREPFGLAVNESLASGTPVIVSDQVGCAPDLVPATAGLVVGAADFDGLAAALARGTATSALLRFGARGALRDCTFESDIEGLNAAVAALVDRRRTQ